MNQMKGVKVKLDGKGEGYKLAAEVDKKINDLLAKHPINSRNKDEWQKLAQTFKRTLETSCDVIIEGTKILCGDKVQEAADAAIEGVEKDIPERICIRCKGVYFFYGIQTEYCGNCYRILRKSNKL